MRSKNTNRGDFVVGATEEVLGAWSSETLCNIMVEHGAASQVERCRQTVRLNESPRARRRAQEGVGQAKLLPRRRLGAESAGVSLAPWGMCLIHNGAGR